MAVAKAPKDTDNATRWLIVGLGNPGAEYERDRHNVGFVVVEVLAAAARASWKHSARLHGDVALGQLARQPLVLLKPQTYMNLSGESAGPTAHFYRIPEARVIAVHDDIDLDLGRIKVKRGGGDGGHKGVRSLARHLGSPDFLRVRVGVGRPVHGNVVNFVLGDFRADEREAVDESVTRASAAVRLLITHGLQETMNRVNRTPAKAVPGA